VTADGDHRSPRVGLIVPSSNVTMEIEIPAMVRAATTELISFHSSRSRMRQVSPEELAAMNQQSSRCVDELADAACDVLAYACLVAVMAQGPGEHRAIEARMSEQLAARDSAAPVVTSAGALVDTIKRLGSHRVAVVAPYVPSLTDTVLRYLESEGIDAVTHVSLGVADNHAVGCIASGQVLGALQTLDLTDVELLVLSACVQMPSLAILGDVASSIGIPVITAASCTAAAVLHALGIDPSPIPGAAGRAWSLAAAGQSASS
jgi:maleate isomerase